MAKDKNNDNTGDQSANAAAVTKADAVTRIGGAINKDIAEKVFGASNARTAFDAVALAGGYGSFNDGEYNGGVTLAIPADDKVLHAKINEALKDLE